MTESWSYKSLYFNSVFINKICKTVQRATGFKEFICYSWALKI